MKCGRSKNLEYLVDHRSRRGRHQKKKKKRNHSFIPGSPKRVMVPSEIEKSKEK